MALKAACIVNLESRRFTYEHVERALAENTATTRMTTARVEIGILFVHHRANHLSVNFMFE